MAGGFGGREVMGWVVRGRRLAGFLPKRGERRATSV